MYLRLLLAMAIAFVSHSVRAEESSFDSNGVKIHYTVQGQGEPVVLVHGLAANTQFNWVVPGVVKELAKEFRVITLDNRGHGLSEKPHDAKQYGMEMVEDIVRLMDHLKIKKAHVVGYSLGAMIVNKLEVTHPDRLLTATLGGGAAVRLPGDDDFIKLLIESLQSGKGIAPVLVALTPPNRMKPTLDDVKTRSNFIMTVNDAKALEALARAWKELEVTNKDLAGNKVPTLALIGSLDTLKPRVEKLKELHMPHLEVKVLPGADHMDSVFRPEFVRDLESFLRAHAPAKREATPSNASTAHSPNSRNDRE